MTRLSGRQDFRTTTRVAYARPRELETMLRPVSPAEFAVRFGLEPVDVEWLMGAYRRGMPDDKLMCELQFLGCSAGEAQRSVELIARETAALVA
jgi:hypothetical protein